MERRDNIEVFNIEWHNIPGKEIDHVISSFTEKKLFKLPAC